MNGFNYFSTKNIIISLATILVVAMGYMAIRTQKQPSQKAMSYEQQIRQIESQSSSDSVDSIEKDLQETDLDTPDQELMYIEAELNADASY